MGLSFLKGACIAFVLSIAVFSQPSYAQPVEPGEGALDHIFSDSEETGAIIIRRLSDRAEWTGNHERVDRRILPASTFKIPNSLIILQNDVVADPDSDLLSWDNVERMPVWDQDQSLRAALRRSAVWAYQHWAREVGHERMNEAVQLIDYGNSDIGAPEQVDLFWLEGPLEISAREQIGFLERLYARALPFDPQVQAQVIDILEHDRGEDWVLRAKTGWALRIEPNVGWFVGWLETETDVWMFALNMDLDWESGAGVMREHLARQALASVGAPIAP